MNFLKKNWILIVILLLAIVVRFIKLDQVPSGLYYDEIDLGYQVRSLLETGKDYRGNSSPFFFRSFNTDKTPIPIVLSLLTSLFFKVPEYQVRSGTALAGVLVVVLGSLVAFQLTKSKLATLITALVFAFSPWLIHFSRLAFEAQHLLLFLLLFVYLLYQWLQTKSPKAFYLSALVLGLSVYTYRTMSFIGPALLLTTPLFFYKNFKEAGLKLTLTWFLVVLALITPFLYLTTIGSKDQTRINQISIFSDKMIPITVQRNRELVSGNYQNPTLGQQPSLQSKIFNNKIISYGEKFRDNLYRNFSPEFLFLTGDPNGRHSAKNTGELLFVDVVGLIVGLFYVFKNAKDKKYLFIIYLLFLGAIPADLTIDGANHASRLISFSGPLLIIVSLGYFNTIKTLLGYKYGSSLVITFSAIWIFAVSQFLSKYFYQFPTINSREFGYGYKQSIQKISSLGFTNIALSGTYDPPMLYYLYWANIAPSELQKYGTEFNQETIKGLPLDKVRPFRPEALLCTEKEIQKLDPKTVYMVTYNDLPKDFRSPDKDVVPQGIKLLDVIKYPDNEVAYYILTRDSKDGKPVLPLKDQKCK